MSGARPPARRVEKIPSRRGLDGVSTDAVAIFACNMCGVDVSVLYVRVSSLASVRICLETYDDPIKGSVSMFANILQYAVDEYALVSLKG